VNKNKSNVNIILELFLTPVSSLKNRQKAALWLTKETGDSKMSKALELKKLLLQNDDLPIAVGSYDCVSARLIQEAGFDVTLMSGYGVAGSLVGYPDYGIITMTEMVNMVRNMANRVDIPVLADGDTGYGNPLNVMRTVIEYEQAGAAAIQLEDQIFPKRCGHMDGKEVISMLEHCRKIEMAANTRKEMLILARSDARATHGIDEAIKRVNEYMKAGADFVVIDAPGSIEELKKMGEQIRGPIMVNMVEGGKTPILTKQELKDMGYSLICYPTVALFAAVKALEEVLARLKEEGTSKFFTEKLETFSKYTSLVGLPALQELEKQYVLR
jgi:2-methylisocitrate lyase-like PEP mutase family enzyme